MITGIKINKIEAVKKKDEEVTGLNVNITVEDVSIKGNEIGISFNYVVSYLEGVGELKMSGSLSTKEDARVCKETAERWEKEKRLPDSLAEMVLNAINYACSTNGVLVVRAINLTPPIVPPRIQLASSPSRS
ncbi:MAG: hypothetical protein N3G22_00040 [Candidatus Micrarchaeota archaeon]|nr:hypothetical protein [Candidatus Micrarchaeota archaeon]